MKTNKLKNRNPSIIFFLLPFLMGINIDIYVPSLPAIAAYFHTTFFLTQLTISSYMLSYSLSQIILGLLSDVIGRRKILITCAAFYTLSCLLTIFAPNIYTLIFSRLLQGFFVGGLSVAIRAAAADSFTDVTLTKIMNNISIGWSLGPIIAPLLGSYLQHYFFWQANFIFLFLYGMFVLAIIYFMLPETKPSTNIIKRTELLSNFKTIATNPVFLLYSTIGSLIYSILVVFNVIGPFLLEHILKISVVSYGRIALILGSSYFCGSALNRYLITNFKSLHIAATSLLLSLLLCFSAIVIAMTTKLSTASVILPTIILFILCGLTMPNIMGKTSSMFTNMAGTASAIWGFIGVIGVFIISIIAALLTIKTQLPMMILYMIMISLSAVMLFVCFKKENKQVNSRANKTGIEAK